MAGLIPSSTLEQIRAASDIVEVIGSYVPLKRAGTNFVALCPFHKEKSPSFNVNPHRQIFHCFGCHKGGDVFAFVKEFENIGFMDAVRRLAERAHIALEFEHHPGAQESRHLKDKLLQIHEQITQRWQAVLAGDAAGQTAREYLAKRGVSEEAVKLFRLGSAPDLWDDTVNWAKSKGFELALVEQAGLIIKKEGSDRYYDRFRGRLMFPICDEIGRVVGFSGRVLSGDEKIAKYVNSPETPLFTKGKIIFGLDKTKRALLDAKSAVICEGQLDLIACFMAGVQNVVAPQGTALTADHARILKRYVEEVVLCFDSDAAGQKAAVRSLDSLLASELAVRVAVIPAPHDPDSYIKTHGGAAFRELIQKAEGFFDYYLNRLCTENDLHTDKGRLAVSKAMSDAVLKTGNAVLFDTYTKKTAFRLGVLETSVRSEFQKRFQHYDNETVQTELRQLTPVPSDEYRFLMLLLRFDEHAEWIASHLSLEWISNPLIREITQRRFASINQSHQIRDAGWIENIEHAETKQLAIKALTENRKIPNADIAVRGNGRIPSIVENLRNQFIDRQMIELSNRLSQPGLSDNEAADLARQRMRLRELKQQPITPLPNEC